ncbi:ABC transporter substrate-binding protein [Actinoplanes sp. NPDC051411]|uniref:ABC transporter substrate-binding protein n=1 Tax=Actinoplanes sp. NPDC051411 TaxID=3155522 RepID=UPI0034151F5E
MLRHRKSKSWAPAVVTGLLVAAVLAGCGGSDKGPAPGTNGLEKTDLKVGILPIPDAATVYIAKSKGYFAAEGLNVTPVVLTNGSETVSRLVSGSVDIAYSAYVPIIQAASSGVRVRVICDGYRGRTDLYPIVTRPDSPIRDPRQLAGKKIGLINTKGFPSLLTDAALAGVGVPASAVHLVEIPYPNMPAALQNGSIDAAFMTEPYLSQSRKTFGARVVVDTMSGPTADLPVGGYVSSPRFVTGNPKTLAAFDRAIAKAQAAAADRTLVGQTLPMYVHGLSPSVAQSITLGVFPSSLDPAQLQRVADLMTRFGAIPKHFDVQQLLRS